MGKKSKEELSKIAHKAVNTRKNNNYRKEFFKKFPKLEKIGIELFYTKLWILLILHGDSLPQSKLTSIRCKSLRDECPELSYLHNALSHLEKNSFLVKKTIDGDVVWRLHEISSFEIRKFKDEAEIQANQKGQNLYNFIQNCAGEPLLGSHLEKSQFRWKDILPDILKESAKGTIRVMFTLVFGV